MESTREIIPCDFRPIEKTVKHPLHTTHVSYSSVVHASRTARGCDVALTVTAAHDWPTDARNLGKRVWSLVAPEFDVQKSVGSGEVVISASKPHVQEKNYVFPQSCCWRDSGELLVLCRAFSSSTSQDEGPESNCAEKFELYLESDDGASGGNATRKSLLATSVLELDSAEAIHSMFFIPHRMERVKIRPSLDGQTEGTPQESEVPCMLVVLISTHGKLFLWKVSYASELTNTQPVVPDGAEMVLSLFEKLPHSHRVLSCVQTSAASILLMSDAHLAVLKIDASSAVKVFTLPFDHLPDPSSPVTMIPAMPRKQGVSIHHKASSLAEIAYIELTGDGEATNCIVGTLEENFTLTVERLQLQSTCSGVIAIYPIQPFAATKRVAVITVSEFAIYCCRFEGLKVFTMNLTRAVAAVWMPSITLKRYTLCIVSLAVGELQSVDMLCDFITLRDDSSLTGQTSIVHAMKKESDSVAGSDGLALVAAESSIGASESYQSLLQTYNRLMEALKKFPHHMHDSQESAITTSTCSWEEVNTYVGALEQSLKEFVKTDGRTMLTTESTHEKVSATLRKVRQTIQFVRYTALHAKTLQKKLTVLRLPEKGSGDRKDNFVVMDGKYPRRTIESSDYSPWPLRPPH